MKFERRRIAPLRLDQLRAVGARDGWLLETSDVLRVGLGHSVVPVVFAGGLEASASAQEPSRVINIGSIDGLSVPTLENYAYSASKAAVTRRSRPSTTRLRSPRPEHFPLSWRWCRPSWPPRSPAS